MTPLEQGGFSKLSRPAALVILTLWAITTVAAIASESHVYRRFSQPTSETGRGSSDWSLYRAVAARLTAGEPYYAALESELIAREYPRSSVFNWRTPAHLWTVTRPGAHILVPIGLGISAITGMVLAWRVLRRQSNAALAAIGSVSVLLALAPAAAADVFMLSEVCAGTLITLSALLFADGRRRCGFLCALLALFVREFSVVYYAAAAATRLSVSKSAARSAAKKRELGAWILGGLAWGVYFLSHARSVAETAASSVSADSGSWMDGGLSFVLSTIEANALLGLLPGPVVAAIAPALLLGLASLERPETRPLRAAAFAYVGLFLFVGGPFHPYWGNMYAPILSMAIPLALPSLATLVDRARTRESSIPK